MSQTKKNEYRRGKIKKELAVFLMLTGGVLALLGLIFMIMYREGFRDVLAERKEAYDALNAGQELKIGDHVTVPVTADAGYVMYKADSTGQWNYYLVPVLREKQGEVWIEQMLLVADKNHHKELKEAEDRFHKWWESGVGIEEYPSEILVTVDGYVSQLTKEEKKYAKDYYGEDLPEFVIRSIGDKFERDMAVIFGAGFFFVGSVLFVVFYLLSRGKKKGENEG